MLVKAIENFVGVVCMTKGQEREINKELAKDLIKAKYVVEVKGGKPSVDEVEETTEETTEESKEASKK